MQWLVPFLRVICSASCRSLRPRLVYSVFRWTILLVNVTQFFSLSHVQKKKISEKRNSETTEQARWWGPTREHWSSAKVEKGQSLLTGLYRGRFSNQRRLQVFVVEILEAKSLRTAKKFLFVKFILRNLETLVPIPWNLGAANEDCILTGKIVAGNV